MKSSRVLVPSTKSPFAIVRFILRSWPTFFHQATTRCKWKCPMVTRNRLIIGRCCSTSIQQIRMPSLAWDGSFRHGSNVKVVLLAISSHFHVAEKIKCVFIVDFPSLFRAVGLDEVVNDEVEFSIWITRSISCSGNHTKKKTNNNYARRSKRAVENVRLIRFHLFNVNNKKSARKLWHFSCQCERRFFVFHTSLVCSVWFLLITAWFYVDRREACTHNWGGGGDLSHANVRRIEVQFSAAANVVEFQFIRSISWAD